jgi:hypothetical protein
VVIRKNSINFTEHQIDTITAETIHLWYKYSITVLYVPLCLANKQDICRLPVLSQQADLRSGQRTTSW